MPPLSRWAVRLALVYLGVGITLGALILAQKGLGSLPWAWSGLGAHVELMLIGWMTQFALGVAYWILPRLPGTAPRGNTLLAGLALVLLNLGLGLAVLAPFLPWSAGLTLARLSEVLGLLLFGYAVWPRIRTLKP
ncbi:hypothetical protein [Thermanaerothrix sp.]|uniref:hypothetical protein n=1 Tax=Thermanaerothrix sp. TaxID=2972675 RepID=UPI002ADE678A|nr:hypothetical protein [Thermanaerothrix sp.]